MTERVNLKAERLNRGLGIAEAAQQIGVPRNTLIRAESGQSTPRAPSAFKIADFYGYQVTEVWPLPEPEAA